MSWYQSKQHTPIVEMDFHGPFADIDLLDATWQGSPVWHETDIWVALDAPDLVYPGPPWPGLLIGIRAQPGDTVRVTVTSDPPSHLFRCVFGTELIVGHAGLWLSAGNAFVEVPVDRGNYPVEIWVDGATPDDSGQCVIRLGSRAPYELGAPRSSVR